MASDRDQWADSLSADNSAGWLTGFLAEEDEFDRRSLWRLGSWGVGSVAAVIVALVAGHSSGGLRKEQTASADLVRQAQQIQWVAKESQNETRRLASAIETLNSDRDRLYSRVTVLEQGLDSMTGSIVRQNAAVASPTPPIPPANAASTSSTTTPSTTTPLAPTASASPPPPSIPPAPQPAAEPPPVSQTSPPPAVAAPATTAAATSEKSIAVAALKPDPPAASGAVPLPASARPEPTNNASAAAIAAPAAAPTTPLMSTKSIMAPPDPAAAKLIGPEPSTDTSTVPALPAPQTIASAPAPPEPDTATQASPAIAVQRTEFGIDLGGANSVDGLRALWRGLLKYRANKALADLRPIIVVKERSSGLGMQLRLVAGPLSDAAAAAKICATLTESDRSCETTIFDGQRLAMKGDNSPSAAAPAAMSNSHPAAASMRSSRRRGNSKGAKTEEPAPKPEPPKPSLTSFLGLR